MDEFVTIKKTLKGSDGSEGTTSYGTCPAAALAFWESKGYEKASPEEAAAHELAKHGHAPTEAEPSTADDVSVDGFSGEMEKSPSTPEQIAEKDAAAASLPSAPVADSEPVVDTPTNDSTAGDTVADSTPPTPSPGDRRGRR